MARLTADLTEDVRLSVDDVGPALSVHLDDEDPAAQWLLNIDVRINEGRRRLGSIGTVPPAAGPPRSRVVALAMCPGALEWFVSARLVAGSAPPIRTEADLFLASSRCCPGLPQAGVSPIVPFAFSTPGPNYYDSGGAIGGGAMSGGLLTGLVEIEAVRDGGAGSVTYLQLWSQLAPPVALDVPTILPLVVPASGTAVRVYRPALPFLQQPHWTHSATLTPFTPAGTGLWVRATLFEPWRL